MQEETFSANNFEQCMKCTICTAYCPVVQVNPLFVGPKQGGPDGERLRLKDEFFFDENLKYCLNCKRCEVACPSGVNVADIIHSARKKYSKHKPGLRERILANTEFMGEVARPVAPVVNAVVASKPVKALMHGMLGVDEHRTFPKYQVHGFESWFKKNALASQSGYSKQLTFFHGCSTEYQHPEVGIAFVKVMNALGYGVNLMDEKCCGVAKISNGLFKSATKQAEHNVSEMQKAVSQGHKVVTVSSTCTLTMRDEYPEILDVENAGVRNEIVLAEKFIYELIDREDVKLVFKKDFHARAAYHVPCHMEKLGWEIFTKLLMGMIPGMKLVNLPSNCCGIAGTYGFKKENYKYSQAIGKPLFDQIKKVDPEYVICECETCKWQIEMSTGYKVVNPIVVLAEALDLDATALSNA